MSLYLCVFDGAREIEGVEVGSYADFNALRTHVAREFEPGGPGSRFPTLMLHSDCDGEWDLAACARLKDELEAIASALTARNELARFVDVDGLPLVARLHGLADVALRTRQPILFQ